MPYSPLMVRPMKEELTSAGFQDLTTAAQVDAFLGEATGTALLFVNSVCGCAAGMARPGVRLALDRSAARPDRLGAVFAGQDLEATARARAAFADIPPSSPSMALFKNGELVYFVPRHRIEGRSAEELARDLEGAFGKFCGAAVTAS